MVWWGPRAFALYLTAYIGVFLALRLALVHAAGVDDVAEVIFAQSLQWSYYPRQPPLYTWLVYGTFQVFGVTLFALALLRYALIAATFAFFYLGARHTIRDERLALLAALSLLLIYPIGWQVHVGYTNTLLLMVGCAASYFALVRLARAHGAAGYALLGAALGVGLLAKFGFGLFAAGLLAAALVEPRLRASLLCLRGLIVPLVAALVAGPYLVLGLPSSQEFVAVLDSTMRPGADLTYLSDVGRGLWSLLKSVVAFLFPFFVVAAVLFAPAFRAPRRAASREGTGSQRPAFHARRFLGAFFIVVSALLVLSVLVGGITFFKSRWMHPALMLAPLYVFVRVDEAGIRPGRITAFAATALFATAVAAAVYVGQLVVGPPLCHRCRLLMPYEQLAQQIRAAGFTGGTVVADEEHLGGNLRILLHPVRVATPVYPFYLPPVPSDAAGQCLLVWNAEKSENAPLAMARFLDRELSVRLASDEAQGFLGARRPSSAVEKAVEEGGEGSRENRTDTAEEESETLRLGYILLASGEGRCR
jgi:4-amino-4-deoxy-L-arabinose transferase-like glycosyltransferase